MKQQITIYDFHSSDDGMEKSKLTTIADIDGTPECYTISYEEQSEELKGCYTVIKIEQPGLVTVIRTGAYNTEMRIEKGKKHLCVYSTPMGSFSLGIVALKIESDFNDGLRRLEFGYSLDFNNSLLSKNRIRIIANNKEAN